MPTYYDLKHWQKFRLTFSLRSSMLDNQTFYRVFLQYYLLVFEIYAPIEAIAQIFTEITSRQQLIQDLNLDFSQFFHEIIYILPSTWNAKRRLSFRKCASFVYLSLN